MTGEKCITNLQDIHVLYDLAIYNYEHFGTYKMLIYEDVQQEEVREYTNVDVAREAMQLAVGLQSLGIQKGDRVIVMMINSPEVIIAYQAIARAGAIIIPVLPLLKATEVRYIAENSAARAIITSSVLLLLLQGALDGIPTMQYVIATGIEGGTVGRDKSGPYGTSHRFARPGRIRYTVSSENHSNRQANETERKTHSWRNALLPKWRW